MSIELLHFGPAHASGYLAVYFPAQHIVATGELIDLNADVYVTGHGGGLTVALQLNVDFSGANYLSGTP